MTVLRSLSGKSRGGTVALALLVLALLARVLVPAGWMPATTGGFSITLCDGMGGRQQMWVATDGTVHDKVPTDTATKEQPCAFAGFAAALDVPPLTDLDMPALAVAALSPLLRERGVAIGRGLAAPPPPPTGPPAIL